MADIRIKDLTTTASSTASDDFIAVDGTTNGTRKLNAFSPTFGGNATVTGTLTVNGAGNSVVSGTIALKSGGNSVIWGTSDSNTRITGDNGAGASSYLDLRTGGNQALYIDQNQQVQVKATTASTSTSTGALVVSGGVGVAGNINGGGDITLATNTKAFYNLNFATAKGLTAGFFSRGTNGGWGSGIHFYSSNTDYSATFAHDPGNGDLHLYTTSSASNYTSSEIALTATAAKQIKVLASTASTSTSSGALVVSGGVGVGGAIFAGGNIQCNAVYASNNTTLYLRPQGATVSSGEAQLTTTGNLTLNGSVQTSAPSGGTAAAWKLGTVASVSPTSPNRTIEVDIGGTIYYIHAKTTNN